MTDYYGTRKMHEGLRTNSDVCTLCQHRLDDVECASCMCCMVADAGCWPGFAPMEELLKEGENKFDYKAACKNLKANCEMLIYEIGEYLNAGGDPSIMLRIGDWFKRCKKIAWDIGNAELQAEEESRRRARL